MHDYPMIYESYQEVFFMHINQWRRTPAIINASQHSHQNGKHTMYMRSIPNRGSQSKHCHSTTECACCSLSCKSTTSTTTCPTTMDSMRGPPRPGWQHQETWNTFDQSWQARKWCKTGWSISATLLVLWHGTQNQINCDEWIRTSSTNLWTIFSCCWRH